MALCGMINTGGCDLDLTHSGPCVIDGRLTKSARRRYGIRAKEVAEEQMRRFPDGPYELVFEE